MSDSGPSESDIKRIIRRILRRRDVRTAKQVKAFLYPDYERDLHDPMLLPDMVPAVERLAQAHRRRELVVIYGDYDVDGLCATALLGQSMRQFGFTINEYLPSRFEDGYGLTRAGIDTVRERGGTLIITVDCGTNAHDAVDYANNSGIDVIVTDHHEPQNGPIPLAVAVINPKRTNSRYPFAHLSGAGVAYKLVQALQLRFDGLVKGREKWLLDLVALSTVCDIMPLVDENRSFVHYGLLVWHKNRRPGFSALMQMAGIAAKTVTSRTLGFAIGPRLNAAGRIEHASSSLALIQATSIRNAMDLAKVLEEYNARRRHEQTRIEFEADELLHEQTDSPVIILAAEGWSHGVVGIVAARLLERHSKPVFLGGIDQGVVKGSVRSFGDFSAAAALDVVRDVLISGGGHEGAAGFSLAIEHFSTFREGIIAYYHSLKLPNQDHHLTPLIEYELPNLTWVSLTFVQQLKLLEPFGEGNPEPIFLWRNLIVESVRRVGADGSHLQLQLIDSAKVRARAVWFRAAQTSLLAGDTVKIMATIEVNEFNGQTSPQLIIKHIDHE